MSLKVARTIRLVIGMVLPVPLFVAIYFFSYLYKTYHGYDYENHAYLTDEMSLSNSRTAMWQWLFAFLFMGYIYMLIPSILYSGLLEVYRTKPFSSYIGYVTLGGTISGISGILFIWINPGGSVMDISDAFKAFILSVFIGVAVAVLLSITGHTKLTKRVNRLTDGHVV